MEDLSDIWWVGCLGIAAAFIFRGLFGNKYYSNVKKKDNSLDDWRPSKIDENTLVAEHVENSKQYFVTYLSSNLQLYAGFLPNIPSQEKVCYNNFVGSYLISTARYLIQYYSSEKVDVKNYDVMSVLHSALSDMLEHKEAESLSNVIFYQLKLSSNEEHTLLGRKVGNEDVSDSIDNGDIRHNRLMNALIKYSLGDM